MDQQDVKIKIEEIFREFEPTFKAHNGGVELVEVGAGTITLRLKGHCQGCALVPLTFGLGIEKLIKARMPEINEIRYID